MACSYSANACCLESKARFLFCPSPPKAGGGAKWQSFVLPNAKSLFHLSFQAFRSDVGGHTTGTKQGRLVDPFPKDKPSRRTKIQIHAHSAQSYKCSWTRRSLSCLTSSTHFDAAFSSTCLTSGTELVCQRARFRI